jgi:hypothetical protein
VSMACAAMVHTGVLLFYETCFSMSKAQTASTLKWFIRTPLAWPVTSLLVSAASKSLARAMPDRLVGFALIGMVDAVGGAVSAALAGRPPSGAWPFIVAFALAHVAYYGEHDRYGHRKGSLA